MFATAEETDRQIVALHHRLQPGEAPGAQRAEVDPRGSARAARDARAARARPRSVIMRTAPFGDGLRDATGCGWPRQ
jgi:hypothetical protein